MWESYPVCAPDWRLKFNIWTNIGPYVQKLVAAEGSGGWRFWVGEIVSVFTLIAGLPRKTDILLSRIEQGKLEVHMPETNRRIARLERGFRSISSAIIFFGLLIAGTQLYLAHETTGTIILGISAVFALGFTVFSR